MAKDNFSSFIDGKAADQTVKAEKQGASQLQKTEADAKNGVAKNGALRTRSFGSKGPVMAEVLGKAGIASKNYGRRLNTRWIKEDLLQLLNEAHTSGDSNAMMALAKLGQALTGCDRETFVSLADAESALNDWEKRYVVYLNENRTQKKTSATPATPLLDAVRPQIEGVRRKILSASLKKKDDKSQDKQDDTIDLDALASQEGGDEDETPSGDQGSGAESSQEVV